MSENTESKEEFCGACVAGGLALAGATAAGVGAEDKNSHKKWKKYLLYGGIATAIIFLFIALWMWFRCKSCRS